MTIEKPIWKQHRKPTGSATPDATKVQNPAKLRTCRKKPSTECSLRHGITSSVIKIQWTGIGTGWRKAAQNLSGSGQDRCEKWPSRDRWRRSCQSWSKRCLRASRLKAAEPLRSGSWMGRSSRWNFKQRIDHRRSGLSRLGHFFAYGGKV